MLLAATPLIRVLPEMSAELWVVDDTWGPMYRSSGRTGHLRSMRLLQGAGRISDRWDVSPPGSVSRTALGRGLGLPRGSSGL